MAQVFVFNRHMMYDYLLVFTFMVLMIQIANIFEPPKCGNTSTNEQTFESTSEIPSSSSRGRHALETVHDQNVGGGVNAKLSDRGTRGRYKSPQSALRGDDNRTGPSGTLSRKHKPATFHGNVKNTAAKPRKGEGVAQASVDSKNVVFLASQKRDRVNGEQDLGGKKLEQNKLPKIERNEEEVGRSNKERASLRLKTGNKQQVESRNIAPCRRSILVYGGMNVIRQWTELQTFVASLKLQKDGDWLTEVPCGPCTVQLTLSNKPGNVRGKDAVVFGMSPYSLKVNMPTFRTFDFDPSQLLVFYGVETPLRMRKWIPDVGFLPNHAVWSYASTAEVHIPYGYYEEGTPLDATRKKPSARTEGKLKLIAWMGSNCVKEVFWPRMDFIHDLQSHIPLDVYGRCGNLTCLPRLSEKCQNLMKQYKFYLALENAECDDYVTEKFWETALMHEVVPVVYGAPREYYVRNAPPNSYIYAGDFKTAKQLAQYLIRLDRSPVKYAKYFEWRYRGSVVQNFPVLRLDHFCRVLPHVRRAADGRIRRRTLSETPWFNSCRNMRRGEAAFLPKDVDKTKWVPW